MNQKETESFPSLVKSEVKRVGLDKFALRYNASFNTIRRWMSGKSKPVPPLEQLICLDIKKRRSLHE